MAADHPHVSQSTLKTPRAAAVAGIVFSVLAISSLVLIRTTVPASPDDAGTWLREGARNTTRGLNALPFAGIAFLWFIGVLRDRLGAREDRFFATVFFGSGLLFLATLFAAAAMAGGLLRMYALAPRLIIDSGVYAFGRAVIYEMVNVYSLRMAGVFMISTCTLSLRTGIIPRWMAVVGLLGALFLMVSLGIFSWAPLVFPLWVLMISVHILIANFEHPHAQLEQAPR